MTAHNFLCNLWYMLMFSYFLDNDTVLCFSQSFSVVVGCGPAMTAHDSLEPIYKKCYS
jgi:hypothetical protein